MNPFYDPSVKQKIFFPKWYWSFLWMFPTYVAFEEMVVFYKHVRGRIYIIRFENYPHETMTNLNSQENPQ